MNLGADQRKTSVVNEDTAGNQAISQLGSMAEMDIGTDREGAAFGKARLTQICQREDCSTLANTGTVEMLILYGHLRHTAGSQRDTVVASKHVARIQFFDSHVKRRLFKTEETYTEALDSRTLEVFTNGRIGYADEFARTLGQRQTF